MAKEYANAVKNMQAALKREIHNKITKATNEKNAKVMYYQMYVGVHL